MFYNIIFNMSPIIMWIIFNVQDWVIWSYERVFSVILVNTKLLSIESCIVVDDHAFISKNSQSFLVIKDRDYFIEIRG